jgi:hypothetical protein
LEGLVLCVERKEGSVATAGCLGGTPESPVPGGAGDAPKMNLAFRRVRACFSRVPFNRAGCRYGG